MSTPITPERRRVLAQQIGMSDAYLYQCLSGIRDMNPGNARRVEDLTNGEIDRRSVCQKTWQAIWPELAEPKAA